MSEPLADVMTNLTDDELLVLKDRIEQNLICPATGEMVRVDDPDALIDALQHTNEVMETMRSFQAAVRGHMASLTAAEHADKATRRLRGTRRVARIELPPVSWDQASLKRIAASFPPELVNRFIVPAAYRVVDAEYKKAQSTTGPAEWNDFFKNLEAACRGRVGQVKVTIEE